VKVRSRPRIVVIYNRDFEGAEADPENKAREDDLAGISYTGSCSFGLSLALRKEKVKDVLRGRGIPIPRGGLVNSADECNQLDLTFPVIVKPAREDASVGICSASVTATHDALKARVAYVLENYRQPALVEEFIDGREVYVSVLERAHDEPQIFPFFEIDFSDMPIDRPNIVSFEGKWVENSIEYKGTRPVRCEGLSDGLRTTISKTALNAFHAVGLRDYGRIDIRLSADNVPYVIDVNPNCDLSDLAGGYSRAAKAAGLSYKDLILQIIELALARRTHMKTLAQLPTTAISAAGEDREESLMPEVRAPAPRGGAGSA
jgi:D-alanine-D-alanine ligase